MTAGWGGAQWVLATLMVLVSITPLMAKLVGLNKKPAHEFAGWYLCEIVCRGGLVVILWWGGFWQ